MSKNGFRHILKSEEFIFTFELVPGRSVRTRQYQAILKFLEESTKYNYFQAFSITDNAGGHPALSPIPLGKTIKELGMEPIIHFSCKDKNRNQIESELLALDREGLHNLLILTGDYPFYGYQGRAKPVYDLDSVQLLQMITDMERGIQLPKEAPGGGITLPAIPFFKGAVVNPFKVTLSELWWQYIKLYKKLKAGAYFIITQVGFIPKKWFELRELLNIGITKVLSQFLEDRNFLNEEEDCHFQKIPLLGSVLFLTPSLIKALTKGRIPGILITETLVSRYREAVDFEGLSVDICAKLSAILKGLGFKGVHLCGFPLDYGVISRFLDKFYIYEKDWEALLKEFDDEKALLELPKGTITAQIPCLLTNGLTLEYKGKRKFFYLFNELFHNLLFNQKSKLYLPLKRLAQRIDKNFWLKKVFTTFEYLVKKLLFNCQECGDCTLWEFNYSCPQSQCAKYLLNGPCGGSLWGYCEVYPFYKRCHFVTAFERAPHKENLRKFLRTKERPFLPPRNWALYKSSSWLNFYLERDHQAK